MATIDAEILIALDDIWQETGVLPQERQERLTALEDRIASIYGAFIQAQEDERSDARIKVRAAIRRKQHLLAALGMGPLPSATPVGTPTAANSRSGSRAATPSDPLHNSSNQSLLKKIGANSIMMTTTENSDVDDNDGLMDEEPLRSQLQTLSASIIGLERQLKARVHHFETSHMTLKSLCQKLGLPMPVSMQLPNPTASGCGGSYANALNLDMNGYDPTKYQAFLDRDADPHSLSSADLLDEGEKIDLGRLNVGVVDLSQETLDRLEVAVAEKQAEIEARIALTTQLAEEIAAIWSDLGYSPAAKLATNRVLHYEYSADSKVENVSNDTAGAESSESGLSRMDFAILSSGAARIDYLELTDGALQKMEVKRANAIEEQDCRRDRLLRLHNAIFTLLDQMEQNSVAEREQASSDPASLQRVDLDLADCAKKRNKFDIPTEDRSKITLDSFENELRNLESIKLSNLKRWTMGQRSKILSLWDELNYPQNKRDEDFGNDYNEKVKWTDELLTRHVNESNRLMAIVEQMRPIMSSISKREGLKDEMIEFKAEASDPSRLTSRGRRDPGRLLREEKFRKTFDREMKRTPKLAQDISAWQESSGMIAYWKGRPYLDIIEEDDPSLKGGVSSVKSTIPSCNTTAMKRTLNSYEISNCAPDHGAPAQIESPPKKQKQDISDGISEGNSSEPVQNSLTKKEKAATFPKAASKKTVVTAKSLFSTTSSATTKVVPDSENFEVSTASLANIQEQKSIKATTPTKRMTAVEKATGTRIKTFNTTIPGPSCQGDARATIGGGQTKVTQGFNSSTLRARQARGSKEA